MGTRSAHADCTLAFSTHFSPGSEYGIITLFPTIDDIRAHFALPFEQMPMLGRFWNIVRHKAVDARRRVFHYVTMHGSLDGFAPHVSRMLDVSQAALAEFAHVRECRDVGFAALFHTCVLTQTRDRSMSLFNEIQPLARSPATSKHEAWIRLVGSCVLPGFMSRRVAAEEFLALPGGHYESYPTPTTLKTFAGDDGPAFERALRSGVKRYFAFAEKSKAVDVNASTGRKVIYLDKMYANFPWPWPEAVLAKLYHMSTGFMPRIDSIWWPTSLMHRS